MKVHLEELLPRHPRIVGQTTDFLRRLGGAPVCILVFLQKDYGPLRETMLESVAASIQTMLLAAQERGLGTCWINAATNLGYGAALRDRYAPDKGELVSLVTLGYPERTPIAAGRKPDRWVIL
jgi:nitroreductase